MSAASVIQEQGAGGGGVSQRLCWGKKRLSGEEHKGLLLRGAAILRRAASDVRQKWATAGQGPVTLEELGPRSFFAFLFFFSFVFFSFLRLSGAGPSGG